MPSSMLDQLFDGPFLQSFFVEADLPPGLFQRAQLFEKLGFGFEARIGHVVLFRMLDELRESPFGDGSVVQFAHFFMFIK